MSRDRFIALTLVSSILSSLAAIAHAAPTVDEAVMDLTHRWARSYYKTPADAQHAAFRELITRAERVSAAYPDRAEPMVWLAIALSSDAKVEGDVAALAEVRKARDLLLAAEKLDPTVLNGSIYASLGVLYANVPGWPVGFGDPSQARKYFEQALKIDPTGIDPNYFYGELLAKKGEYAKAYEHLKKALGAPPRPGREDSDAGRREEASILLNALRQDHPDQWAGR